MLCYVLCYVVLPCECCVLRSVCYVVLCVQVKTYIQDADVDFLGVCVCVCVRGCVLVFVCLWFMCL